MFIAPAGRPAPFKLHAPTADSGTVRMGALSAAIPLIGAAVGAIGGSDRGGGSQTTSSTPWAPQGQAIQGLYDTAQSVYASRAAAGPYTGDYYSGMNGIQAGSANQGAAWAGNQGAALTNGTGVTAGTLQTAAQPFVQNADTMASGGAAGFNPGLYGAISAYAGGTTKLGSGIDPALAASLNKGAIQGTQNLSSAGTTLGQVSNAGLTDATGQIIGDATQYANSGYAKQAAQAARDDIQQTLGENLSGINFQASQAGSLNSSRAGMAEAMARRDAARAIADSDASIYGNAFNTGVAASTQNRLGGLNASTTAAGQQGTLGHTAAATTAGLQQSQGQFDTTSRLGAAEAGLNADTMARLNANAQLGSAAGAGVSAAGAASGLAQNNFSLGQGAGGVFQTDQNAQLNNDFQKWQAANKYQQDVLSPYAQIILQGYNGAPSSATSQTLPSNMMGNVMGGALAASGLYKNFNAAGGSAGLSSLFG